MIVELGKEFARVFSNFPVGDQDKILDFIEHVEVHGFDGLEGKNVSSTNVDKDDPQFILKVQKARQYNLFHYHIGIPSYRVSPNGYKTSEYVIHYRKISVNEIKIVDMSSHPPFQLPSNVHLDDD